MLITNAVLFIDAENAFNSINRKVMLHNLKFICPIIATYKINCYPTPSRLFIVGGRGTLSIEEATQDDQTAMGAYVLGILPLIKFLLQFISLNEMNANEAVFADEFSVADSLNSIKDLLRWINSNWPKIRLLPKTCKTFSDSKRKKLMVVQNVFTNSRVNITAVIYDPIITRMLTVYWRLQNRVFLFVWILIASTYFINSCWHEIQSFCGRSHIWAYNEVDAYCVMTS